VTRARYHCVSCDCLPCSIKRCVYVLLVAKNNEVLSDEDFEVGQLILAHAITMEELDEG
jgi:hypothetical protein